MRHAGVTRPLVVTDKGVGGLPFRRLGRQPGGGGLEPEPFDGVWGNPVEVPGRRPGSTPTAHDADGIVGLGGGAALDVAKAIALMATHPGDLFDYEDEMPGARPIDDACRTSSPCPPRPAPAARSAAAR